MNNAAPEWAYDEPDDADCSNCGGEGFVAMCVTDYECVDPESGCDLCMRRCDWCSPPKASQPGQPEEREGGSSAAEPHTTPSTPPSEAG